MAGLHTLGDYVNDDMCDDIEYIGILTRIIQTKIEELQKNE